jgi:hypothetical protein
MDSITALTLAVSLISTGIAVFSLVYTKRQVDMQRRDFDKRKNFEKASSTILQVIAIIKDAQEPVIAGLQSLQSEIVTELYDNPPVVGLALKIKPEKLELSIGNAAVSLGGGSVTFGGGKVVAIKDSQQLKKYLIESEKQNESIEGLLIFKEEFSNITKANSIRIDEFLYELRTYYSAYRLLSEIGDVTQPIDNTVISEVQKTIDSMTEVLFESSIHDRAIIFEKDDKSHDIYKKLNYGIISIGSIIAIQKALVSLCDSKLFAVQKKLFEMAFQ